MNTCYLSCKVTVLTPKVAFLHYWGIGSTTDLAKALNSALDTQRKIP